jgi:hypothetical protein
MGPKEEEEEEEEAGTWLTSLSLNSHTFYAQELTHLNNNFESNMILLITKLIYSITEQCT